VGYLCVNFSLGFSVFDLGPMNATDRRQTDVRRASLLNVPTLGAGHNKPSEQEHSEKANICHGICNLNF